MLRNRTPVSQCLHNVHEMRAVLHAISHVIAGLMRLPKPESTFRAWSWLTGAEAGLRLCKWT